MAAHYTGVDGSIGKARWDAASEASAEPWGEDLDQLESVLRVQDTELRRTRTELELRNLYVAELHAVLKRQAEQLEQLGRRLERLEGRRHAERG